MAGLIALLSGCSSLSLYFHNEAYEKSTTEAQEDVKKLDVAGAFKSLLTESDALARNEDQAAVTALVSMRNRTLSRLVDPNEGDWEKLDPARSMIPTSFASNGAPARLEYLIRLDLGKLLGTSTQEINREYFRQQPPDPYLEGAQRLVAIDQLIQTEESSVVAMQTLVRRTILEQEVKSPPPIDCETAAKINAPTSPFPGLPRLVINAYVALDGACQARAGAVSDRIAFIESFDRELDGRNGLISQTAREYLEALESKSDSEAEAEKLAHEVSILLKKLDEKTPEAQAAEISRLIDKLNDAKALAKLAGFNQIDSFLQCGLLADLRLAQAEFAERAANPDVAASASESTGDSGKDDCALLFGNAKTGKSVSAILKVLMGAAADGVAVDRLKRLNANILALADLRQRLSAAQVTVAYVDNKLLLYKGQFYSLLDQYRLLMMALKADLMLPDTNAGGFAEFSATAGPADKRYMAIALSSYVAAWNYGRVPLEVIDFRFIQARRNFDIQLASVTAGNHKALIQPIADALAAYGKGGITPDTLAEVLSNLGIISGLFLD